MRTNTMPAHFPTLMMIVEFSNTYKIVVSLAYVSRLLMYLLRLFVAVRSSGTACVAEAWNHVLSFLSSYHRSCTIQCSQNSLGPGWSAPCHCRSMLDTLTRTSFRIRSHAEGWDSKLAKPSHSNASLLVRISFFLIDLVLICLFSEVYLKFYFAQLSCLTARAETSNHCWLEGTDQWSRH